MDPALAAIIAMQRQQQEAQAEMLRQRNLQAQAIQEQAAAALAHARTKKQREVYVGNLTPGITSVEMLKQVRLKPRHPTTTHCVTKSNSSKGCHLGNQGSHTGQDTCILTGPFIAWTPLLIT